MFEKQTRKKKEGVVRFYLNGSELIAASEAGQLKMQVNLKYIYCTIRLDSDY